MTSRKPQSPGELAELLAAQAYLADEGLATALYLGLVLAKPVLLEGEAGVGKTEVARALAEALGARLIRLQCYEGIDASQALYEWNYARQLLYIRTLSEGQAGHPSVHELFGPEFLVERPLLAAVRAGGEAVLLIDEIDRADDAFEAFLLEVLSDFSVTIPELGTVRATEPPVVILTSNRTRDLHDALKRRCLYHWIDYPTVEREVKILRLRAPEVPEALARRVGEAVERVRAIGLAKPPGIAETIDWARALRALGSEDLDPQLAAASLGALVKEQDDLLKVRASLGEVVGRAADGGGG